MRECPNVENIDLGDNQISNLEMTNFAKSLKTNRHVSEIKFQGNKNITRNTKAMMQSELKKNKQITEYNVDSLFNVAGS